MKLQQSNNKTKDGKTHQHFFISLPIALVKAKSWQKGQALKVDIDAKGQLVLKEE